MRAFDDVTGGVTAQGIDILQVNVGLACNQACSHCHLEAGPGRTEIMAWEVMEQTAAMAQTLRPGLVDITGGAPELHPRLRNFIAALRGAGLAVMARTNLTALFTAETPESKGLAVFYRRMDVALTASLPCYLEENVDAMRGPGVYRASIAALKALNALGYAAPGGPALDLVFNPGGAFLPPSQSGLEADYRRELATRHGIVFNRLLTLANVPLGRFRAGLRQQGQDIAYREMLRQSYNPCTLPGLMCRHQVSVGYDGRLFDCDFNMILGLPVAAERGCTVFDFDADALCNRPVVTGEHCFACTAGAGSSCGGALTESPN